ncbi:MAG: 4a-hydroxytetrahydrobiopterin dehydratase [Chloroflexi bacterium]|nr:4a-hydroxytetrahydrobiopterin dehydratase [Chloroflexota bacterium]MXX66540.1 4a-hydroxytetrahydrobiopterin dehydratase [Chloroflexota bacterium]
MPDLLTPEQLAERLKEAPDWSVADGQIAREFTLATFVAAIEFVGGVAAIAERLNHHPDIDIRYRRVRIAVSTHSAGGLTELDFELAAQVDRLQDD